MSYTEKAQPSFSAGVAVLSEYSAVAHSVKSIWPLLSPSRNLEFRTEILLLLLSVLPEYVVRVLGDLGLTGIELGKVTSK